MQKFTLCIVLALFIGCSDKPGQPEEKTYKVMVIRHWKVGQKFELIGEGKIEESGVKPILMKFKSIGTVIEVNQLGHPTAEAHEIVEFSWVQGKNELKANKKVKIIVASGEEGRSFKLENGKKLPDQLVNLFGYFISPAPQRENTTPEELEGLQKRVGESWPGRIEKAGPMLFAIDGATFPREGITISEKLSQVSKIDGKECMTIETQVEAIGEHPDFEYIKATYRLRAVYPVNTSLPQLSQNSEMTIEHGQHRWSSTKRRKYKLLP